MGTILIIDDQPTHRELMGKVVSSIGHQPTYASDAHEGLNKAKELKPVLILLDVVMPGELNGFSLCRKLKSDPVTSTIPVVLVTTKSTDSDRFWGKKQGADEHVCKPFSKEELASVIRRLAG